MDEKEARIFKNLGKWEMKKFLSMSPEERARLFIEKSGYNWEELQSKGFKYDPDCGLCSIDQVEEFYEVLDQIENEEIVEDD